MTWQNRIVGYGEEPPDQLLANPRNWRTHPASQTDALAGVLRETGWVQNVIVNRTTGFVVDGHARIALALRDGQPTVPITYVELDEAEEALILASLDPIAALAGADAAKLDDLLREVSTGEAAVAQMLADLAEQHGVVGGLPGPGAGGDEFDATPDDGPTRCQSGDLWVIGGVHRLICGDSTDPATVARLMGGERADAVVTDPPYEVAEGMGDIYERAGFKAHSALAAAEWDRNVPIESLLSAAQSTLGSNGSIYVFTLHPLFGRIYEWLADRCDYAGFCVWHKTNPTPSLHKRHWTWAAELVCFGTVGRHVFNFDDGSHTPNVWPIAKGDSASGHPTQKPVAVIAHIIQYVTRAGALVTDVCLGSGTTLIAAHRTGRRCYGVELEPRYCDVILRRAEAEGLTVERADG